MVFEKVENEVPPLVQGPSLAREQSHSSTRRSIETLIVVLAVITILGVIAGIFARFCGGQHFAGSRDHDIEGWVEKKCRNCIDGGIDTPPPPPPPKEEAKPAAEEVKK